MSLKGFVNNPSEWSAFLEELDKKIEISHRTIEGTSEPTLIYREQGKIWAYRNLKGLRDTLNGPESNKK